MLTPDCQTAALFIIASSCLIVQHCTAALFAMEVCGCPSTELSSCGVTGVLIIGACVIVLLLCTVHSAVWKSSRAKPLSSSTSRGDVTVVLAL